MPFNFFGMLLGMAENVDNMPRDLCYLHVLTIWDILHCECFLYRNAVEELFKIVGFGEMMSHKKNKKWKDQSFPNKVYFMHFFHISLLKTVMSFQTL